MRPLRTNEGRIRAPALARCYRGTNRRRDLQGVLVSMAPSANHADQPLWAQRHGPAGPELSQEEHGSILLQERRRRRRGHDQEGHDRVVVHGRTVRAWGVAGIAAAVGCASVAGSSLAGFSQRPQSPQWGDSLLGSLSLRHKAAQLLWPQVSGDYTPDNIP